MTPWCVFGWSPPCGMQIHHAGPMQFIHPLIHCTTLHCTHRPRTCSRSSGRRRRRAGSSSSQSTRAPHPSPTASTSSESIRMYESKHYLRRNPFLTLLLTRLPMDMNTNQPPSLYITTAPQARVPLGRDRPRQRLRAALVPAAERDCEQARDGPAVEHVGAVSDGWGVVGWAGSFGARDESEKHRHNTK